jgi:hypothetical protein
MDVVNRHHVLSPWPENYRYVGRGTPLGNPYIIGENGTREEVISKYESYLRDKIESGDPVAITALRALSDDSALVCSCAPLPCHADVISSLWREYVAHATAFEWKWHEDGALPINGEVFVFGSNLAGRHGAGAAAIAAQRFGATYGVGRGYLGRKPEHCYAIPTKDQTIRTRPLDEIRTEIEAFRQFVLDHPDMRFFITRVGCGLAGYKDAQIAPFFRNFPRDRCSFPDTWKPHLAPRTMFYAGIGSRKTPPDMLAKMKRVAARLEKLGYTLRSGGADGADSAFAAGCGKKEIYLPWDGFNGVKQESGHTRIVSEPSQDAEIIASLVHPAFGRLTAPVKKLMARNSHQILGHDLRTPVDFVVCWTPDGAESGGERSRDTGGTGQAIALASMWGIPVFNLARGDALERLGVLLTRHAQAQL